MYPTTIVAAKAWYASKTFWVNAIVVLLGVIGEVQEILPAFADILVLPASATRWLLLATAVGNIILRRISDQPMRFQSKETAKTEGVALPVAKGPVAP